MQKFDDIMFDCDPLELADELATLEQPITVVISTDEEAEVDDEIYFGLPTEVGEIIEVKATVVELRKVAEELYDITVVVTDVDQPLQQLAIDTLTGTIRKATAGEPVWAVGLKQQNSTYAVLANSPGGIITSEQLAKIAEMSEKGAGVVKLTHAQRVVLLMHPDQLEMCSRELKSVGLRIGVMHHGIRNVRACCGALCRFAQQTDSIPLAKELDERFFGRGTAFDIKIAISDCMRNCSESYCADIGLIADKGKYGILVGGRGSQVPFRALRLIEGIESENVTDVVEEIVDWYAANAQKGERLHKLLSRLGSSIEVNLTGLEDAFSHVGDGINEVERMQEQLLRLSGMKKMRQELSCCN